MVLVNAEKIHSDMRHNRIFNIEQKPQSFSKSLLTTDRPLFPLESPAFCMIATKNFASEYNLGSDCVFHQKTN